jgi:quercetin dioxygenase-like cupin family protein
MRVTWHRSGESESASEARFTLEMTGSAAAPPVHIHPNQEERITVVEGSLLSETGGVERVLTAGERVVTPPGEPHTVGPAGGEAVRMLAELRPALGYRQFLERSFAMDRAGYIDSKGRGNPVRLAATGSRQAEYFLAGIPIGVQRALLAMTEPVARRLGYDQIS